MELLPGTGFALVSFLVGGVEAFVNQPYELPQSSESICACSESAQDEPPESFLGADRWSAVLPRPRLLEL
jgi:hypothetical protein